MISRTTEIAALMRDRINYEASCAAEANHYECISVCDPTGHVVAAARMEPCSWYACEVKNIAVRRDMEGKRWGRKLLAEAERYAAQKRYTVLMATVRSSNFGSQCLFYSAGYQRVSTFISNLSYKPVSLWVKTVGITT